MTVLVELTLRTSIVVLIGLLLRARLRRRSAALRHVVLAIAVFAGAAALPMSRALPRWETPMFRPAQVESQPVGVATADGGILVEHDASVPDSPGRSVIPMVWAAGLLISLGVMLFGFGRIVWVTARAEPLADGPWVEIARQVAEADGLARPITLLQTTVPGLLATWGAFRPRVLLPPGSQRWSRERIRVVLCHELAHVRRRDWIVQMAAEAVRAVNWFNPLVWMACTRLRRESEQACDDAVLGRGVGARDYAAHLIDLARLCRRFEPAAVSAMLVARPSTLERRIAAMLNADLDRRAPSRRAVVLATVLLLAVTLPTAAFHAAQTSPLPLAGSVYDPTGAVLPGVDLILEDAQEFKWEATTDAAGRFEFPPVQPGKYVLHAALPGFRALRHEFELRHARDWDRAVTLQVGQITETVTVRAARTVGPAATAPGPQPIRVGGNIRAPRKLHNVNPVYPVSMREAGREGIVPIEAIIGRDGAVISLRVLSAQVHPDFAAAAIDAVRQWRFAPTLLNGEPVDVSMTVSVRFSLED
jgi:TonB family protein